MTRGQFQGCSISLSGHLHRWKRGENICQSQDKREVGKRGLHAATKAQPFISRRLVSTSQLISLVHNLICQLLHYFSAPKERLCIKERVVLDLLVCLQNQKQWHLLLSSSHLSFPRRPNGVPRARLLLPSRWLSPWLSVLAPTLMSLSKPRYDFWTPAL